MKVALVCDWLTNVGGAEKVLLELHKLYKDAPIYTSQYDQSAINWFKDADIRTSRRLQKIPVAFRRLIGPFRQWYFSHLDLSEYDLVISVSGAEAKAVKVKNGLHICYCHIPTQYYWSMYKDYIKNPGFGILNPIVRLGFRLIVPSLRRADLKAARRVDYFITISEYSKQQIKDYYGRESTIIHPPVEVDDFASGLKSSATSSTGHKDLARATWELSSGDQDTLVFKPYSYYVTTSRQVNWKRIDLAVKACLMSQRHLLVIGEGPEHKKLTKLAKGSDLVKFLPFQDKANLAKYVSSAKAYLFPSLEPFGIAPVEALAAGCPVIAYGEGGALDYIIDRKNGLLFKEQTAASLANAILEFEKLKFNPTTISRSAAKFSTSRFDQEIRRFVKKCEKKHAKKTK